MSSPGNQVVKSSLLTPARRIGLSRTRKSQKIEICSPLLGVSEPILKNPASEYENKLFHTTGRSSFSETSLEVENSSLSNLSESKIEENTVEQENTSIVKLFMNTSEVENASLSNLNDSQISNKNTAEVAETLSSNSTISKNKTEDPAASSVMCSPNLCETFSGKIKRKLEMDNNGFNEKFNSKKSKGRLSRNSPKIEDQRKAFFYNKDYTAYIFPSAKNIGKKTEKEKELVVDLYNITEPLLTNSTTDSETDHNNYNSKLLRTTSSTDSENDIFTSSPEAAQLQREKLMKLMETLTEDIEAQESLLKRLQQVKIYRRIQNIDEIKKTTIQWTEGFKQALMDLLLKLQTHGTMTMEILIKKLKISPNIVDKLNLDEEL